MSYQWHNSRGGRVPPNTSRREISADLPGKERQGNMEKKRKEKKENKKREGGKLKIEGGKGRKWGEDLFFFFAFHFSKPLKFGLGVPKWEFSYQEKAFHTGKKKSGKINLPPWKIFLLCPCVKYHTETFFIKINDITLNYPIFFNPNSPVLMLFYSFLFLCSFISWIFLSSNFIFRTMGTRFTDTK